MKDRFIVKEDMSYYYIEDRYRIFPPLCLYNDLTLANAYCENLNLWIKD